MVVLGGAGFIGRRVVGKLVADGWDEVVAVSRRGTPANSVPGVVYLKADATAEAELAKVVDGTTGIVNCVTGSGDAIVNGARALFSVAASATNPPRIVHMSSLAAYGSSCGIVDEAAPLLGDLGEYSAAKRDAERLARSYPNAVLLRPGIVYGPESETWCGLIGRLLMQRRLGDLGAAGDGICNLVHVDDVSTAAASALKLPGIEGQAFNLGMPTAISWNQYFEGYAKALGAVPLHRIGSVRWALELKVLGPLLKVFEIAGRALRLPSPASPIRPWLRDLCVHELYMRVEHAESGLGLRWKPLEDGLAESAAWFHSRHS